MNKQQKYSCILLTTNNEFLSSPVELFARQYFDVLLVSKHSWADSKITDKIANVMDSGNVDYLFSFLSPVIVPQSLLLKTKKLNINIHPAPPEYPGVGSASFAIYDEKTSYGTTAHIMEEKVDTGRILKVTRFPIYDNDTCETLDNRSRIHAITLAEEIMVCIAQEKEFPFCDEQWQGRVMTRKEFKLWMIISSNAIEEEVNKKIKALRHRSLAGPYINFHGHLFGYKEDYNK
jgi:methionyl-tRNA formyltransferase